ncbi:hypothetical protein AOZ06_13270 [Kibdelosporangium phytohabitans]|uniref:PKD domain-containing protein n=1 Tax=Kibdelosporangium phytohabitans TaxID=860235 RepID=A0A0N9HX18_9PSEU|nr:hypothetical protein AOZ06_13270 [Kibdelosporangium phytohabitans]
MVTGTEQVLIEDWCQQYPSHSVGDLEFGPDGYLYASAGDDTGLVSADYGQAGSPRNPCGDPPVPVGGTQTAPTAEGGALRSQDYQTTGGPTGLDGTVIRIASPIDGTVDNFGWPCMEGNQPNGGYNFGLNMCERIYSEAVPHTPPHFTYHHSDPVIPGDGCETEVGSSVSGAAFYNGDSHPAQYKGTLFFADYSRRCVWAMFPGTGGVPDPATRIAFRNNAFAVDLEIGPNGGLFYVDIAAGEVRRVRYNSGNQPQVASITASPAQGSLPLTVSFSAAAANDPEGAALSYAWDLDGDGNFDDGTGPAAARTYRAAKVYNVSVRASDPGGLSDVVSKRIFAGTTPPTVNITTPVAAWAVGDTVSFNGTALDARHRWQHSEFGRGIGHGQQHRASRAGRRVQLQRRIRRRPERANRQGPQRNHLRRRMVGRCEHGRALSFDGVDDVVTVADSNLLDLTNGMTLEAWIRPNTAVTGWRTFMKERTDGLSYALYGDNAASQP